MNLPDNLNIQDWFDSHDTSYYDYKEREYDVRLDKISRELQIRDLLSQTW